MISVFKGHLDGIWYLIATQKGKASLAPLLSVSPYTITKAFKTTNLDSEVDKAVFHRETLLKKRSSIGEWEL